MKFTKQITALLSLVALAFATACAGAPTMPEPQAQPTVQVVAPATGPLFECRTGSMVVSGGRQCEETTTTTSTTSGTGTTVVSDTTSRNGGYATGGN